jgi:hypothetical protein
MSINDDVDAIIATRRPVAENIDKVKAHLGKIYPIINELEQKKSQIVGTTDDREVVRQLNALNFPKIQSLIMNQLAVLEQVQKRFERQSLNLGVVARAKQGKSRLLRSFTGLSSNEIPDGDSGHCTGIASTIFPNNSSNETYADVWFYTHESFLTEVIAPYYEKLQLGSAPQTISDFEKSLPPLPNNLINDSNILYQQMYIYLEKYHTHLQEYKILLGSKSPQKKERAEIRKYVAQYDLSGNPTYDYMAVQKCNIICPFPSAPTDKMAVVDTQGLGDTGVGDEERLIKVLGENVDVILFMRMPHPVSDAWKTEDINLYSVANRVLANHLPLKKWSFLILNQTNDPIKGNNFVQSNVLKNQVPEAIKVIDIINANCADETEAQTQILEPIVKYLVGQVQKLDREYVISYQQELNLLHSQINTELEKAINGLFKQVSIDNEDELFEELFEEFWDNLTVGLDRLVTNLRSEPEAEDSYFHEQVKQVIKAAEDDTAIPSDDPNGKTALEKIDRMISNKKDAESAYSAYLDLVRTHLTHHFLDLDDGLNRSIEQAKIEIARFFIEELNFSNLTDKRGSEFIQAMAELLPAQRIQLKEGFQILSEYKLSFKGLILPRIRPCLKGLSPFPRKIPLGATIRQDAKEQILFNMTALHGEAIYQCENALNDMLGEPVQAALAIVEEFKEQVINKKKVKTEWRLFLQREKAKIWVDEFGEGDNNIQYQKEWQDLIQRATQANSLDNFQFIN